MSKQIVHLTSVHTSSDVRIFLKECLSLQKAGYDVSLIAPHNQDELVKDVYVHAIQKPTSRLIRITIVGWKLYRKAVSLNADIYHLHDPELIPLGLLLQWGGKKVIYDIHEDVPATILTKDYLPKWTRFLLSLLVKYIELFACCKFSGLVPATPAIARRFNHFNRHSVVVQNFPLLNEWDKFKKDCSSRESSVAYVGGILEGRGIFQMIEAIGLLPSSFSATLKLAGDFYPESLHDQVAKLPGWRRVKNLGFLSRTEVSELLNKVSAGLVLLHPEPRYQVSYPIKLFEYMAAGIPVIASDFPLWREIIEEVNCGILVNPLEPKEISVAIEYILSHPSEAEAMGRRGREAVEQKYNWGIEEAKLLGLYQKLI